MTEHGDSAPAALLRQPTSDAVSAGTLLRRAREAAGMHPAGLAAVLKVPVQKIEALEADRFDLLPDLVFVRALASSISRTLDLDPLQVLERLPRTTPPRLVQDRDGVNAPFRGPDDPVGPRWRDHFFKPVVLAVTGLLLAAGALMLLPQSLLDDVAALARATLSPRQATLPVAAGTGAAVSGVRRVGEGVPFDVAAAEASAAAGPASASLAAYSPSSPASPASGSELVSKVTTAGPDALPPESPVAATDDSAAAAGGLVVFRTRQASWIEVTDARGTVAIRRMLAAGETAGASGVLPLTVKVGKASVTDVLVRGKGFDLGAVTRDDVARFQVK